MPSWLNKSIVTRTSWRRIFKHADLIKTEKSTQGFDDWLPHLSLFLSNFSLMNVGTYSTQADHKFFIAGPHNLSQTMNHILLPTLGIQKKLCCYKHISGYRYIWYSHRSLYKGTCFNVKSSPLNSTNTNSTCSASLDWSLHSIFAQWFYRYRLNPCIDSYFQNKFTIFYKLNMWCFTVSTTLFNWHEWC